MYMDHRILSKISKVLGRMDMSVMLLDGNGLVILPEDDPRVFALPEALVANPTRPLVYGGVTLIGTDEQQPVYVLLQGDSQEVKNCAILIAQLISTVAQIDMGQADASQSMRLVLRGEIDGNELTNVAREYGVPLQMTRIVVLFHFPELDEEKSISMVKQFVAEDSSDMLMDMGRHTAALIYHVDEHSEGLAAEKFAEKVTSACLEQTGQMMYAGISEPKEDIGELADAYVQAKDAIGVGYIYHPQQQVYVHSRLLLERFLNDVPADMRQRYHEMMFSRRTARLFNEEMLSTIEKFFENSLNLSETARQLYIHRNTLVYRLDKVQRATGLDLRAFDDAVTFKLMMLLGKNSGNRRR